MTVMYTVLILAEGGEGLLPILEKYQHNDDVEEIYVVCNRHQCFATVRLCDKYGISKVQGVINEGKNRKESALSGLFAIEEHRWDEPLLLIKETERPPLSENFIDVPCMLSSLIMIYQ